MKVETLAGQVSAELDDRHITAAIGCIIGQWWRHLCALWHVCESSRGYFEQRLRSTYT